MTHVHIQNFSKCLLGWGKGRGLNHSVTQPVLFYLQDKHPSTILRKYSAKKIAILLENLDFKRATWEEAGQHKFNREQAYHSLRCLVEKQSIKFAITSPLSFFRSFKHIWSFLPTFKRSEVEINKKNIFMRIIYCGLSINQFFLNSLKFYTVTKYYRQP